MIKSATHKNVVKFSKLLKQEKINDLQSQEFIRHYFLWRSFVKFGTVLKQENPQRQKVLINTSLIKQFAYSLCEPALGEKLLLHLKTLGFKTFEKSRARHFQFWTNQGLAQSQKDKLSNFFILLLSCEKKGQQYLNYLKEMLHPGKTPQEKRALFLLTRSIMNLATFQVDVPKLPEFKVDDLGNPYLSFKDRYSSAKFSFTTLDTLSNEEALLVNLQNRRLKNGYWEETERKLTVDLRYVEDFFIQETNTWLNLYQELGVK